MAMDVATSQPGSNSSQVTPRHPPLHAPHGGAASPVCAERKSEAPLPPHLALSPPAALFASTDLGEAGRRAHGSLPNDTSTEQSADRWGHHQTRMGTG